MKPDGLFFCCCGENEGALTHKKGRKSERHHSAVVMLQICFFLWVRYCEWFWLQHLSKEWTGPEKCAYEEPRYKVTLKEMDSFNLKRPMLRRDFTSGYKITKCIDWEDLACLTKCIDFLRQLFLHLSKYVLIYK